MHFLAPLFFMLIILLHLFSLLFSTVPHFNADIFVCSWLVSFPRLLYSGFSYLRYLSSMEQ